MENFNKQKEPDSTVEDIGASDSVVKIINTLRKKIEKMGLPAIFGYNFAKMSIAFGGVMIISDAPTDERLAVASTAAGAALILSHSFWVAMSVLGVRFGKKIIQKK